MKKSLVFVSLLLILPLTLGAKTKYPKRRIISLKPNITQSFIDVGLGDQIVGITKYCPKPNPKAKVIGDYKTFNVEEILKLNPDFIYMSKENANIADYKKLAQALRLGYQDAKAHVYTLNFETFKEFKISFQRMTHQFGKKVYANDKLNEWKKRFKESQEKHPKLQGKSFVVLVQRHPTMVASGNTFISSLLKEIGLVNAFEKNMVSYPVLNKETILEQKADYLFDLSHDQNSPEFLGLKVIPLKMEDFNARPYAVEAVLQLAEDLDPR